MIKINNNNIYKISFLILIITLIISVNEKMAHSQGILDQEQFNIIDQFTKINLQIEKTPEYPKPNEIVNLRVDTFSTDLNRAHIKWELSEGEIVEGVGLTTIETMLGSVGEKKEITVSITDINGEKASKTFTLTPSDIDILWHTESHTTPLYKGKPLFLRGGMVVVTALVNVADKDGNRINENNLIYTWKINGSVLQGLSGIGKSSFRIDNWEIRPGSRIGVSAETIDGSIQIGNSTIIGNFPITPQLYEVNSLYGGMYNKAITDSFSIRSSDLMTIKAYPFFMDSKDIKNKEIEYSWNIDGNRLSIKDDTLLISPEGLTGISSIKLFIINKSKLITGQIDSNITIR